ANSTIVKLHLLLRTESSENRLALLLGKASEIEFIVIAQELAPLSGGRTRPGLLERDGKRSGIATGKRIEKVLIDLEVEHHLQPLSGIAEILKIGIRQDVRLSKN